MAARSADAPGADQRLGSDFRKYWVGQTISNLGSSFTSFALPLIVFKLTGSATSLALSGLANSLPMLLFGLIIGAWVDRVDRRRLMIGADLARAAVLTSIPLLFALGLLSVGWIYGVGFVSATLSLGFSFAQVTAIPSLVPREDLVIANGRIRAGYATATAVGPLLAGLLVAGMPLPAILLVDALSFLVSAGTLLRVRTRFNVVGAVSPASLHRAIAEGLRYVLRHPVMGPLAAMAALVVFVASPVGAQLVLFARERLRAGDAQIGLLYSAESVGVILLSLAAGPLCKRCSCGKIASGSLMFYGLLTLVLAGTRWYWAAVPLLALTSGLIMLFNISAISLRQAIVPNEMLGRVSSTLNVLVNAATPLGVLIGGLIIERTGNVALVYGAIGLLVFLIALAFSFTPLGHPDPYLPGAERA
jgi:Transmembrane secretion effector